MYNIGARYEVIGRITQGTTVIEYVVTDSEGCIQSIKKGVFEQLALNKKIYNCTAQVYQNSVCLKGINCKLNQMPRYIRRASDGRLVLVEKVEKVNKKSAAEYMITGKVIKGRMITEYILVSLNDPTGRQLRIDRDKVIRLAKQGKIINVRCQMNGNEEMLRAAPGYQLSKIKTLPR